MKFGSSSWLVIYTKSIPCFTHLQRPYPNRQFPESEIFSQSNWKSEIYHILSEGRESPQSPYNRKTANTAFHLKPSRRWWQSPQLHVKIKPVSLLPPSSGASLTDSHGAEQWQPVINMSPEESQAAEPCRLEDKLSYTSWAAEVGIPHESPRLVQIGFTPSANSSLWRVKFSIPHSYCYFAILSPQCERLCRRKCHGPMALWPQEGS